MSTRSYGDKRPEIPASAYVDRDSILIGDVVLEDDVTIWPGAILRGDDDRVIIRKGSAVMDASFVEAPRGGPVTVGRDCMISHGARLHGCVIEDCALVGIGAIVLDGVTIGRGSTVAAGSVVTPGTTIPSGSLAMGTPAKVARATTDDEASWLEMELGRVREKARVYAIAEGGPRAARVT